MIMFLTSCLQIKTDDHFLLFNDPKNTGGESFNGTVK